ncbi:hypothetical protein QR680_011698 [Steinernema hermaphroditum]|nr:hypothetical protein QR680_011698 [Steinernema hermaphroditum]
MVVNSANGEVADVDSSVCEPIVDEPDGTVKDESLELGVDDIAEADESESVESESVEVKPDEDEPKKDVGEGSVRAVEGGSLDGKLAADDAGKVVDVSVEDETAGDEPVVTGLDEEGDGDDESGPLETVNAELVDADGGGTVEVIKEGSVDVETVKVTDEVRGGDDDAIGKIVDKEPTDGVPFETVGDG